MRISLASTTCILAVSSFSFSSLAQAKAWGLSIGHNNPPGSLIGGNLIYFGNTWAFEIGVGQIEPSKSDSKSKLYLGGDVDFKYFFAQTWRPYIEGGFGYGIGASVGSDGGAGAGFGGPFVGVGLMYEGSKFFGYIVGDYVPNGHKGSGTTLGGGLGVKF